VHRHICPAAALLVISAVAVLSQVKALHLELSKLSWVHVADFSTSRRNHVCRVRCGASKKGFGLSKGFGALPTKRKRTPSMARMNPEKLRARLQEDHGDKWEAVERVIRGEGATCPEEMCRARFSALRVQDSGFMANTENGEHELSSLNGRLRMWEETFGQRDPKDAKTPPCSFVKDVSGLKVLETVDNTVLYKVYCGTMSWCERNEFIEHPKWGYIHCTGKTSMEDEPTRKWTEASIKDPLLLPDPLVQDASLGPAGVVQSGQAV